MQRTADSSPGKNLLFSGWSAQARNGRSGLRLSPKERAGAANVNPFTPLALGRKRGKAATPAMDQSSQSESEASEECGAAREEPPAKKVRVCDMNVTRYQVL
jgi:hypothetical protein